MAAPRIDLLLWLLFITRFHDAFALETGKLSVGLVINPNLSARKREDF